MHPLPDHLANHGASPCDLCGYDQWKVVSHRDRHQQPLTTALCTHCGLISHLPLPDEATIAQYYAEEYRHDYHGERTPAPRRVMRAWRNGERIYHLLAPYIPQQGSVFEVGAGLGCTVKVFQHHGFDASGIEPNHDFNQYSRQQLRANIDNRNLFTLTGGAHYNLILLVHVIEHFRSPTDALMKIRDLLADDGQLYIECPNVAAPFATFRRLFHFAHIHNFAPATLQLLAEKCGFAVQQVLYDDDHPDIGLLLKKTAVPASIVINHSVSKHVQKAIHHFTALSYHLRISYLQRRMIKLGCYARERLMARAFVQRLLHRCAQDADPAS